MSDTPWTDERESSGTRGGWECCRELERELSSCDKERIANLHRAWKAEAQLDVRYGLRNEINAELGLTDEIGDDALRKGIETINALKAERDALKEKLGGG